MSDNKETIYRFIGMVISFLFVIGVIALISYGVWEAKQ